MMFFDEIQDVPDSDWDSEWQSYSAQVPETLSEGADLLTVAANHIDGSETDLEDLLPVIRSALAALRSDEPHGNLAADLRWLAEEAEWLGFRHRPESDYVRILVNIAAGLARPRLMKR